MDNIIFFTTHDEFYVWLAENHTKSDALWVGYFRKSTGRASLTWSASVDAALCFGWIDGVRNSIDDQSYKIRFTPRKSTSIWSAVNVQKVQTLIATGKMKPAGLRPYHNRRDAVGYTSEDRNIPLSKDFETQIKANPAAWDFFDSLAPSYRRDSIWWVMSAKKEETQLRRLGILISSCQEGLKIPSLRKK
tara:strand:- start:169 stop:738 length:570 start_codon:yes stop_codon:yes gene_type:complete